MTCLACLPAPVLAVDPATPTTFTLDSVQVVTNILEDDDMVVAFRYNITYSSGQPSIPANKLFHFRLMDTDGITQLGAIEPYPYYNSGYGQGFSAFYFAGDAAPDWESALVLKMVGNPQYWASPPEVNYTLTSADYSQLSTRSENSSLLGNYIIETCRDLEINWSVKLVTETPQGTILNDTGAAYGRGTIPGLQNMCPQIFSSQQQVIDIPDQTWTNTKLNEWIHQFDGTVVGDALIGLSDLFSVSWIILTSLICVVLVILVFVWGMLAYSDNQAAMVAGIRIFSGGALMGIFHPAALALITLVYAAYTAFVIIGDKG
ncbi:hypothetical protein [Dehalococcoides mccartyi]|uniref:hypothetical protein n=1 Tax=Dehalococcoides mccartyi TaxID=61435 RepID=UPI001E46E499|nr:hypothetical protein [Dehalococcoides mccartyi]